MWEAGAGSECQFAPHRCLRAKHVLGLDL